MKIDDKLEYLQILSQINIDSEKKDKIEEDLLKIIDYMNKISEVDTDNIEPLSHINFEENVCREDEVIEDKREGEILSNAPIRKDDMIVVPKSII